ncbi:MAG: hydroxysqualene dehydroxylase HpnE [Burkholderiales bacterium]|nr:hydroxysqualene dehydroxylase HpnE [Burkholderiales bacterium]
MARLENVGRCVIKPGRTDAVPSVAILGAGYAGVAAAVRLCEANIRVSVFESARTPGGRARGIHYRGYALDNGQHMLIGAYQRLLGMMKTVGLDESGLVRLPMQMRMHPDIRLTTPKWPAPLHLAWGLATAGGLTWRDKLAAARMSDMVRRPALPMQLRDATVEQLLAASRQTDTMVRAIWLPLCIAALNTPIQSASAGVFANVLRDSLFKSRADSDFLLPRIDLTAMFPGPALEWVEARGGIVRLGTRVRELAGQRGAFRITAGAANESAPDGAGTFDAVICAVGPHQLDDLAGDAAAYLPSRRPRHFEPICTIYLAYPVPVPLPAYMVGRQAGMTQWFFDRSRLGGPSGLISAVISASGPHDQLSHDEIATRAHGELQEIVGTLPTPDWSKVIAERFATFACTTDVPRPTIRTTLPGLYLAGDYTDGPYPATLEGAVRSGEAAAASLLADFKN